VKILLIEDDAPIREVVKRGLEENRLYSVDTASDGKTGLNMAITGEYAVIVLDLMLPKLDGWQVCEELRARRINTSILMLTARDAVKDRILGLEIGADDYLPKPFDFDELLARIKALMRRDKMAKSRVIHIEQIEIDTGAQRVFCDGNEVALTLREYALLEALATNEGRILSRDTILSRIWNTEASASNTVDVYIGLLRKKLEHEGRPKLIHTVHGLGYTLRRPDSEADCPQTPES